MSMQQLQSGFIEPGDAWSHSNIKFTSSKKKKENTHLNSCTYIKQLSETDLGRIGHSTVHEHFLNIEEILEIKNQRSANLLIVLENIGDELSSRSSQ